MKAALLLLLSRFSRVRRVHIKNSIRSKFSVYLERKWRKNPKQQLPKSIQILRWNVAEKLFFRENNF